MTTRSKNKPASKQVPKTPPGISLVPDPITAARTHGVEPLLDHQLPAAVIESARTHTTTATSPLVTVVPLSIISGPVPLIDLPDSGLIPSAPEIIPSPLAPDLCALFQQFMITTSELQHRSIMDATTFQTTMEDGLSSLKTELGDNLVDQLKQAAIQDDSTLHSSVPRPPPRQHPGQYYAVPDSDDSDGTVDVPQRSWERVHDNPFTIVREHHFLQVASRNNHCSKFKYYLTGDIELKDDSLVALERFVDSIKGALQAALSFHKSFEPYSQWTLHYSLLESIYPQSLSVHPRFQYLCCNVDAYGHILYLHLQSPSVISAERCPLAYQECIALRSVTCDWSLFQELIFVCSPHLRGTFRDYRLNIQQILPVHNETILVYFQRTQDLSREITLARDASGMLHELLHHFLQALCANGESGFTRTTLSSFDRTIKRLRRDPQHITVALSFTFYDIQVELRDVGIITFRSPNTLAVVPDLVAAAQLRPHKSPYARGDPSIIRSQPRDPQTRIPQPHDPQDRAPQFRDHQSRPQPKGPYSPRRPSSPFLNCKICLNRFRFSYHETEQCYFLHDDNIQDKEVRERIMQFRARHKIQLPPLPAAFRRLPAPPEARLPSVRIGDATVIPEVEFEDSYADSPMGDVFEPDDSDIVDSSQLDFPVPPQACLGEVDTTIAANSVIHNPMEYRTFQE
jgi:hypothetical protein